MKKYLDGSGLKNVLQRIKGKLDLKAEKSELDLKADKDELATQSNPNFLDNWYFVNPINQNGQTMLSPGAKRTYFTDRWATGRSVVNLTDNGISLAHDGVNGNDGYLQQVIETTFLCGKTVTFSAIIENELHSFTAIVPTELFDLIYKDFGSWRLTLQAAQNSVNVALYRTGTEKTKAETVSAVKLELGSYQTLAHKESDIWVLNDPPPNPATELAKCQRYQFVLRFPTETYYLGGLYGKAISTTRTVISIPLSVTMRAKPTVRYSGEFTLSDTAIFAGKPPVTSITMNCINSSNVVINAFTSDILTVGEMYCMVGKNSAETNLILDANL